jgi:glycosyltransferase involved in cell wall biosynthesis
VRICIIGKYPPIQGGVSMRTYWSAHGLAALGHAVHVVTNAKEAVAPFRMLMRTSDWERCAAAYGDGSVTVHWTDPVDRSQSYIPMASPFVSKLAGTVAQVHAERPFDVIYSHYLEPYGVAGFLAAQMTHVPHVTRMAGSDAGRLWHHPQLALLYDHVLRSADAVVAMGEVATRAVERGVSPDRIVRGGGFATPADLFTPQGPTLDIASLRDAAAADPAFGDLLWGNFAADRPYFGVYGKLGERKGSFALIAALHRLMSGGLDIGLVALAHGGTAIQNEFRARVVELGLIDRVLQVPFLPHWRVADFLRGCLAVCCLEQDFPISFHSPVIPLEVLLCGACLVGSTEVIRKLPNREQLVHGYNCVALEDVNDIAKLSETLGAIVRDPGLAACVGMRGRTFACETQERIDFPRRLETILTRVARRERLSAMTSRISAEQRGDDGRFHFTRMAAEALAAAGRQPVTGITAATSSDEIGLAGAHDLLHEINRSIDDGSISQRSLAQAVATEIAIAAAEEDEPPEQGDAAGDPLFRLHSRLWAIGEFDFRTLVPVCHSQFQIVYFDYDVSTLGGAATIEELPRAAAPRPSCVVVFHKGANRNPLIVDIMTARFLEVIDGCKTVDEILQHLDQEHSSSTSADRAQWVENLFRWGLIGLRSIADEPSKKVSSSPLFGADLDLSRSEEGASKREK